MRGHPVIKKVSSVRVSRPSTPMMTLQSSVNLLVIRLFFMTFSLNFARGDHGACVVFERKITVPSYICFGTSNDSKACAKVLDGIISPELCASPSCELESIIGILVPVAVADFLLQIILAIVLLVIYLPKYHPAQRRTLYHTVLRCVKLVIPFIGLPTCIVTLLYFRFLSEAAWPLITMGCVAEESSSWDSVQALSLWGFVMFLTILKFISLAVLGGKDLCERRANVLARGLFQYFAFAETATATEAQKVSALEPTWSGSCCICVLREVLEDISARRRYQKLHQTTEANEVNGSMSAYTDEVNTFNDETTEATDTNEANQNAHANEEAEQTSERAQITVPSLDFSLALVYVHMNLLFSLIDLITSTIVISMAFGSLAAVEKLLLNAKNREWCVSCLDERHDIGTDQMLKVDLGYIGLGMSLVLGISIIALLIFTIFNTHKRRGEFRSYRWDADSNSWRYEYHEYVSWAAGMNDEQFVHQE